MENAIGQPQYGKHHATDGVKNNQQFALASLSSTLTSSTLTSLPSPLNPPFSYLIFPFNGLALCFPNECHRRRAHFSNGTPIEQSDRLVIQLSRSYPLAPSLLNPGPPTPNRHRGSQNQRSLKESTVSFMEEIIIKTRTFFFFIRIPNRRSTCSSSRPPDTRACSLTTGYWLELAV